MSLGSSQDDDQQQGVPGGFLPQFQQHKQGLEEKCYHGSTIACAAGVNGKVLGFISMGPFLRIEFC